MCALAASARGSAIRARTTSVRAMSASICATALLMRATAAGSPVAPASAFSIWECLVFTTVAVWRRKTGAVWRRPAWNLGCLFSISRLTPRSALHWAALQYTALHLQNLAEFDDGMQAWHLLT
jgi:hypothetical protein